MVYEQEDALDLVFQALSDRTRRDILKRLATKGSMAISELSLTYDMTLAAVSKHVKVLEKAGLLLTNKQGRAHLCAMQFAPLERASAQIEFYKMHWHKQLDGLDDYVQGVLAEKKKTRRRSENGKRKKH